MLVNQSDPYWILGSVDILRLGQKIMFAVVVCMCGPAFVFVKNGIIMLSWFIRFRWFKFKIISWYSKYLPLFIFVNNSFSNHHVIGQSVIIHEEEDYLLGVYAFVFYLFFELSLWLKYIFFYHLNSNVNQTHSLWGE